MWYRRTSQAHHVRRENSPPARPRFDVRVGSRASVQAAAHPGRDRRGSSRPARHPGADAVRLRVRLLPRGNHQVLGARTAAARRRLLAVLSPALVLPDRPSLLRVGQDLRLGAARVGRSGSAVHRNCIDCKRRRRCVLQLPCAPAVSRSRDGARRRNRADSRVPVLVHQYLWPRSGHPADRIDDRVHVSRRHVLPTVSPSALHWRGTDRPHRGSGVLDKVPRACLPPPFSPRSLGWGSRPVPKEDGSRGRWP